MTPFHALVNIPNSGRWAVYAPLFMTELGILGLTIKSNDRACAKAPSRARISEPYVASGGSAYHSS